MVCITLFGCGQPKDKLSRIDFGIDSYDWLLSDMLSEDIITEPDKDSLSYRYYIEDSDENKRIPVLIRINPDRYKFGSVRQIELDLAGDTIYWIDPPKFARGAGVRLCAEVDSIYALYVKWHGEPDSVSFEERQMVHKAFWKKKNCIITFIHSIPREDVNFSDKMVYSDAKIKYEMYGYEVEFNRIRDSIRQTLTPNDLINVTAWDPRWESIYGLYSFGYNRVFKVTLSDIKRKDREEPRAVIAFRFDVVLEDRFGTELHRFEDITIEPNRPLYGYYNTNFVLDFLSNQIYEVRYHSSGEHNASLEFARHYNESNEILVKTEIKAVVFQDGEILK